MNIKQISFVVLSGFIVLTSCNAMTMIQKTEERLFPQDQAVFNLWCDINTNLASIDVNDEAKKAPYEVARTFFIDITMAYQMGYIQKDELIWIFQNLGTVINEQNHGDISENLASCIAYCLQYTRQFNYLDPYRSVFVSEAFLTNSAVEKFNIAKIICPRIDTNTLEKFKKFTKAYLGGLNDIFAGAGVLD